LIVHFFQFLILPFSILHLTFETSDGAFRHFHFAISNLLLSSHVTEELQNALSNIIVGDNFYKREKLSNRKLSDGLRPRQKVFEFCFT